MNTDDTLSSFTADQLAKINARDFVKLVGPVAYERGGIDAVVDDDIDKHFRRSFNREKLLKAVAPGSTTTWGALSPIRPLIDSFLGFLRPATLIDRILCRKVPFNTSVMKQTAAGVYQWIGEGNAVPTTFAQFGTVQLPSAKAAGIIVVTKELLTLSTPSALDTLQRELIGGIAQYPNVQLTDPAVAAVDGLNPASITNGVTPIASTGTSAAALLLDVKALIASFLASNPGTEGAVLLMPPSLAVALAVATNSQTLTMHGGTIFGIDVLTSGDIGAQIIMLNVSSLLLADDNIIEIDVSRSATIEMSSTPASPAVAATVTVSLFQHGLIGLKCVRTINWRVARPNAVAVLSNANYL